MADIVVISDAAGADQVRITLNGGNMSGGSYVLGNAIAFAGIFTHNGAATDPSGVVFKLINPRGVQSAYTYSTDPGSVVKRAGVGNYTVARAPDLAGLWRYRFEGSGAVVAIAEGEFTVPASPFT